MKKLLISCTLLLIGSVAAELRADVPLIPAPTANTAPPTVSSPTVTASTEPPSVALTGETTSAPKPAAMTTPPGGGVFVTLTRTAYHASALPTSAEVVKPETFQIFDAQNAGEAIARQAGVQELPIIQVGGLSGPAEASIRGGSALVLIDGRPMQGFALGPADLSEIPTEQIDHIEILRGGASALYGPNAEGGVINVISKRAQYNGLPISHVGLELGSEGRQGYTLDFGSRYGPLDYYFYGDNKWISGLRADSDDTQHNIGGNFGLSMGKAGKFLFDASNYHSDAGVPGLNCGPNDTYCFSGIPLMPNAFDNKDEKPASSPDARQITDTNYLRTSYILPLPKDSLLTFRVFGMQRSVQYDETDTLNPVFLSATERHDQSHGAETQLALPYGLLFGGNFLHDREDHTDVLTPSNTFIASEDNWSVFGQDTFKRGFFTLIPSGRFDHNSQAGDSKSPRVQLLADATDWLRFSGSAAHSFRTPTLDELYLVSPLFISNPNLQPETAWTYDTGFEIHHDSVSFQATYFLSNVSNLIQSVQSDPNNLDSPFEAVNIGSARRQGAEVKIDHVFNEHFRDSWNYTYLNSMGIPTGFDHDVLLDYSPHHTANYIATITPTAKWVFDLTAHFEGSRYSGDDGTGYKLGSELLAGFRITYKWRQMDVYIGANDINNKHYVEQPGYSLPGATGFGGISLRLWG